MALVNAWIQKLAILINPKARVEKLGRQYSIQNLVEL